VREGRQHDFNRSVVETNQRHHHGKDSQYQITYSGRDQGLQHTQLVEAQQRGAVRPKKTYLLADTGVQGAALVSTRKDR
jgi:hypothetical protein